MERGPLAQSVEQQTFNSYYVSRYIEYQSAMGRKSRSFMHLRGTWLRELDGRELGELTPELIEETVDRVARERNWCEATRTLSLNVLSGFLGWLVRSRKLRHNPCKLVPRKSGRSLHNVRKRVLSNGEVLELVMMLRTRSPEVADLTRFASLTGMRFGVMTALTPDDVHFDHEGDCFVEFINKNGDEHPVYLVAEAKAITVRLMNQNETYLFAGPRGGKLRHKKVIADFRWACELVGLPYGRGKWDVSFHSLRRYFAAQLLNKGVSKEEVMELGGWRSYAAVDRYAILSNQTKKRAMKKASKYL